MIHTRFFLLFLGCLSLSSADQQAIPYTILTVAGSTSVGDGGPALAALFSQTEGIAVGQGNIYVADADNHRVRKIAPNGTISTVAGTGIGGFSGDGALASEAMLNQPYGLAVDTIGNLYIADLGNARVRKVTGDGRIQTVAGGGATPQPDALNGPALNAQFNAPRNVAVDPDGTLYISDFGASTVYRVSPAGILTILAGTGTAGYSGDGTSANLAQLKAPAGIASDGAGSVYIADSGNNCIRLVLRDVISTFFAAAIPTGVAFSGATLYVAASDYVGSQYAAYNGLSAARDVAVDSAGNLYATTGQFVTEVTAAGAVNSIAGSGIGLYYSGDGGPASAARFRDPSRMAIDAQGNMYVADTANNRIREIAPDGSIVTIAGTGTPGLDGDSGPALHARLNAPQGVAIDAGNNIYVADTGNNKIRKIAPDGTISTFLDGLNNPEYAAVSAAGSLYVADTGNDRVLLVSQAGVISVLAQVLKPAAVVVDESGNIWISELTRVSKIDQTGLISVAVDRLNTPRGLAFTTDGVLLIAESGRNAVRSWTPAGGLVTIAGTGVAGFSGDGGLATAAQLNAPSDIAVDANGVIWVIDSANNCIRTMTAAMGTPPAQQFSSATLVNAASLLPGNLAPGEIVSIFGAGFDPVQTELLFDGNSATTFYVGPNQINALAPATLTAGSSTQIGISVDGSIVSTFSATVDAAVPGIFTIPNAAGQAAATNQDGSINSTMNPADRGSVIVLYATGQGADLSNVSLTIGGYDAALIYAGPAPGFPGLMQINAQVPSGFLTPGILPVVLSIGDVSSQDGVTIAVR